MHSPRQPRVVLISTVLALVVLGLFTLSFLAVFLLARPTPLPDIALATPTPMATANSSLFAPSQAPMPATPQPNVRAAASVAPTSERVAAGSRWQEPAVWFLLAGLGGIAFVTVAFILVQWQLARRERQPVNGVAAPAATAQPTDVATLRAARRRKQLTYDTLAQRTGLSVRYLAEIEHADRTPDHGDVELIRKALEAETAEDRWLAQR